MVDRDGSGLTSALPSSNNGLRGAHPRWGPRRLGYELGRSGISPVPSRSTIYRVLVRHGLVPARKRKRRRQDYKRWQREAPMQLWQLDVTGSVFLADGTECKLISGIDDHSRFCVIATAPRTRTLENVKHHLKTIRQRSAGLRQFC